MGQIDTKPSPRWAQYEALCENRDAARARHKDANETRHSLACVIAGMVAERPDRIVTEAVPETALAEYRQQVAEVEALRSAWFDARDKVEAFMGRPAMLR